MPKINFHPECDILRFTEAAEEYTKIWKEDGERITETIERLTGFKFGADTYNAIVYGKDRSESYPLTLNCKYLIEQKKSTLIHELTHKVLPRNDAMKASELENHKVLDLVLYDIWTDLYGKEFADNAAVSEYSFQPLYEEAWKFALALTKEERSKEFQKFKDSAK